MSLNFFKDLAEAIKFAHIYGKPSYIETNSQCAALCKAYPMVGECPVLKEELFTCDVPHCVTPADVPHGASCVVPSGKFATKPACQFQCNSVCWGSDLPQE